MRKFGWLVAGVIVFVILIFGGKLIRLYTDWLWFRDLGFSIVFTKSIFTSIWLALGLGVLFFILVYANLWAARRLAPPPTIRFEGEIRLGERLGHIARTTLGILLFLGTLAVSGLVAIEAAGHWDDFLRFTNSVPFGVRDPLFGKDIGFYVFQLPFIRYIYGWLFFALIVAALATAALHYADEAIQFFANRPQFAPRVKGHLLFLFSLLFFLKAWGYRLDRYELLYRPHDQFFGAGYADVNARLVALNVLSAVAVIAGILVLANIKRRGISLAIAALAGLIGLSILVGSIYPSIVHQLVVKPNELEKQERFIKLGIEFTRKAYGLDKIRRRFYPAVPTLSAKQLSQNRLTIENIRLWDYQQLLESYAQIQQIRPYYRFQDADVDRYTINGRPRQVLLAARELAKDSLPVNAQTWVNRKLQYTHGYGAAMSPVNEISNEGMPVLFIRDIPPESTVGITIRRPQIYFGELTDDYVLVNTTSREFDYSTGDVNAFTSYKGSTGVPIGSMMRRILFAARFGDINIILNDNIRKGSRALFRRDIRERARALLPFLQFDRDPYLVISDGRIYWFHDAYTYSDRYPYSQPARSGLNYIRNSVKIVTDAYNGTVTAYIADMNDPIIKAYSRIFPGIMRPLSDMPAALRAHIRYPQDLFEIQSAIYGTYHMTDPRTFYNKEDLWSPSRKLAEDGAAEDSAMEPYYLLTRLPGETEETFILLTPMDRANQKVMGAWLAARSDPDRYGELIAFIFPKGQLVYGPSQIAARANQDEQISQQLTLWDQRGSHVTRGTMLVIPIERSILYVEPVYLESTQTKIPELKRVIVALGPKLTMAPSLKEALATVIGTPAAAAAIEAPTPSGPSPPGAPPPGASVPEIAELVRQAREQFNQAERLQREGDWAGYGRALERLKRTLADLERRTASP